MGSVKNAMMEHETNLHFAAAYLVKKGALEQCSFHEEIYGGDMDLDRDFWRYATADWKRGEHGLVPWASGMEQREFTDLLKAAYEDHLGDECGFCAKHRDRD